MPISPVNEGTDTPPVSTAREKSGPEVFSKVLANTVPYTRKTPIHSGSGDNPVKDKSVIVLGRISKETPTVSHILMKHPEFSRQCWDIIFSSENRGKEFRKMKEGTVVALRSGSNELLWGRDLTMTASRTSAGGKTDASRAPSPAIPLTTELKPQKEEVKTLTQHASSLNTHRDSLVKAVKQYIGTPYNKIDCYGLIVRALQNQGIQYRGRGGIREMLETLAVRSGLPRNAYFTGEGLVEKAGTRIFSKSIRDVSLSEGQTEKLYSEISPYLREGYILSFSTSSRGHTGIVSKKGEHWTYINSGVIDNEITPVRMAKGVGEEFLKAEIKNWLSLAAKRKEPLTVTIGHVGKGFPFHREGSIRG